MAGEGGAAGKSVGDRTASLAPAAEVPAHDGVSALPAEDASDLRSLLMTSVLNLEKLDADLHRGTHHWVPRTRRLFGGQIIGQALVAAARSVSEDFFAHSLHCYFVRAGDPKVPVLYQVERTRDGRSFLVRSVKAIQHGKPILICQASFQIQQPSPLQHHFTMPTVPFPEELLTAEELIQKYLSSPNLAENAKQGLSNILAEEIPIEIKPVNPPDFYGHIAMEPKKLFWVRARGHIGGSRGLVQGRLWRRDGVLAASCAQEGVLRVKERSKL
ncbi:acyl-coenzyme A thioesterase 8 isoform X2 [Scleropages formosus]|uniref:acyl-coenzyme A thioesterase 8 isoform X2 n=1 Tax=Scleropages formosus TaxID=113540 RepID=UPI000878250A|nr:acyl-coenzyme A thioesterase 8 isoform X2 [Scleropages formosus]